ncbi:ABC transporter substrate-binding protein [Silanimonas sp.]|jgi:NitT/TauT family transport system substrate-binding protein|uniref:ABC transporter substrate-binding protein n=1 Tax=Silanimonas sp. TaxID=1929290 RepID=UPI0037CA9DCF
MPTPRTARLLVVLAFVVVGALGVQLRWGIQAPETQTLRIGIGPWIGYEPFVAERELGQWPERVALVELESNTETLDAFIEGRIDVAGLTLDETLRLARRGVDHRVIAVLSDSRGGDAVLGRPGLAGLGALAGRPVLVEDTAVGTLMLAAALDEVGLSLADVQVERTQATRIDLAWSKGFADAVVAYSPVIEQLQAQGAVELFSTRDHPGLVLDVLVVRPEALQQPETITAMIEAWDRGLARLALRRPQDAALLAPGLGLSAAEYTAALDKVELIPAARSRAMFEGRPSPFEASLIRIEAAWPPGAGERAARPLLAPEGRP